MESIGIRELRQHASVYVRRAGQGESFEVTDRGTPVALLASGWDVVRIAATELLDELVARGEYASHEDALRVGVNELARRLRQAQIDAQIEDGYRRIPQSGDEDEQWLLAAARTAWQDMDPW